MRVADLHTDLIGRICKLNQMAVPLEREYEIIFGFGNAHIVEDLFWLQEKHCSKIAFIFIDEKPFTKDKETWFCIKEFSTTNKKVNGDYHWLTLNQLIICI